MTGNLSKIGEINKNNFDTTKFIILHCDSII